MKKYQVRLGRVKKLSRRMNSGISFFLVLRGELTAELGGNFCRLSEGDAAAVGNMEIFSMESGEGSLILGLFFSREYLEEAFPEALRRRLLFFSDRKNGKDADSAALRRLAADIAFRWMKKENGYELKVQSEIYELFYCLLTGGEFSERRDYSAEVPENSRLFPVLEDIHRNFRYPMTLKETAACGDQGRGDGPGAPFAGLPAFKESVSGPLRGIFDQYGPEKPGHRSVPRVLPGKAADLLSAPCGGIRTGGRRWEIGGISEFGRRLTTESGWNGSNPRKKRRDSAGCRFT